MKVQHSTCDVQRDLGILVDDKLFQEQCVAKLLRIIRWSVEYALTIQVVSMTYYKNIIWVP